MKNKTAQIILIVLGIVIFSGAMLYIFSRNDKPATTTTTTTTTVTKNSADSAIQNPSVAQTPTESQEDRLLYLIEEEKLAHDVYATLYDKWQSQVFGNIINSETSHQKQVLVVLQSKNIADPRSSEVGVFKNQKLQELYNKLVAQGSQSVEEAYKVGVTIEELDIADLTADLAVTTDQDVIALMESLRNGSENHLRAFNRQLNRIQS